MFKLFFIDFAVVVLSFYIPAICSWGRRRAPQGRDRNRRPRQRAACSERACNRAGPPPGVLGVWRKRRRRLPRPRDTPPWPAPAVSPPHRPLVLHQTTEHILELSIKKTSQQNSHFKQKNCMRNLG